MTLASLEFYLKPLICPFQPCFVEHSVDYSSHLLMIKQNVIDPPFFVHLAITLVT